MSLTVVKEYLGVQPLKGKMMTSAKREMEFPMSVCESHQVET